jgi:hypothetical protein
VEGEEREADRGASGLSWKKAGRVAAKVGAGFCSLALGAALSFRLLGSQTVDCLWTSSDYQTCEEGTSRVEESLLPSDRNRGAMSDELRRIYGYARDDLSLCEALGLGSDTSIQTRGESELREDAGIFYKALEEKYGDLGPEPAMLIFRKDIQKRSGAYLGGFNLEKLMVLFNGPISTLPHEISHERHVTETEAVLEELDLMAGIAESEWAGYLDDPASEKGRESAARSCAYESSLLDRLTAAWRHGLLYPEFGKNGLDANVDVTYYSAPAFLLREIREGRVEAPFPLDNILGYLDRALGPVEKVRH